MGIPSGEALHDFVAARYRDLRRAAFLMCGDWAVADEQTRSSLARLVAEMHRGDVEDPDAYVYSHLMAAFQHRPARREHVFVAGPATTRETTPDEARADAARADAARADAAGAGEAGTDEAGTDEAGTDEAGAADRQAQTVLVLDALHRLTPRCRAVLVLRHATGFAVDETADLLGLADERAEAYEAAGVAALDRLLTGPVPEPEVAAR